MSEEEPKKLKPLTQEEFLNAVSLIASGHNCIVTEVDLKNKIVHLSGAKKDELECFLAIEEFFALYESDNGIEVTETEMGWPK